MQKEQQSILDFLPSISPSFLSRRSVLSNQENKVLYEIWQKSVKDEYGKYILPNEISPTHVSNLVSKGYLRTSGNRLATKDSARTCEFTDKGKEAIKQIILGQEKSALEQPSIFAKNENIIKTASNNKHQNWLSKLL